MRKFYAGLTQYVAVGISTSYVNYGTNLAWGIQGSLMLLDWSAVRTYTAPNTP